MARTLIVLMGTLGLCVGTAMADEASDRRRAISDAERLVSDMARSLSGLAGDSSARGIENALRSGDRLKSKLRDLDRVKGSDSKARNMVSRWPRYVDKLKQTRRPLQTLKKHQRSLKKAADRCQRQTRDLERFIQSEVRKDGPNSVRAMQDKAKSFGREASKAMRSASDQRRDMERAKSDAKRFDASDGNWRDVRSRIKSAADRMYSDWKRDFEKTKRACESLSKGERHPNVSKGIEQLKRMAQKRKDLQRRVEDDLKAIVSKSKGLDQARDAGPIQQVGRALSDIQRRIRDLDKVKGGDPKAKAIASTWPRTAAGLGDGIKALIGMKAGQYALKNEAKTCQTAEKALIAQAKAAAATPEAASRKTLEAEAKRLGGDTSKRLDAARKQATDMKRFKDRLGRLKGDGPWKAVVSNLRGAGAKMVDHYNRDLSAMQGACGKLAQGIKHPEVGRALNDIAKVLERVDRLFKALSGDVKTLAGHLKSAKGAKDSGPVDRARAEALRIHKTLQTLERDKDPRAQERSKAWLTHFRALDTSLKGLKTLKDKQAGLAPRVAECAALNTRAAAEAARIQTLPQLEALEKGAGPFGKTVRSYLSEADKLAKAMSKARAEAGKFGFGQGEWGAVKSAFKSAGDAAMGAFNKDRDALKSTCAEMAKGPKHAAVAKARQTLMRKISAAERASASAGKSANKACAPMQKLIAVRVKRMSALQHFVNKINKERKYDTKPAVIKSLRDGIKRAEKELEATAKSCAAAMKTHAKADTAWEALQGR